MKPTIPAARQEPPPALEIQSVNGPDCGPPIDVTPGRHLIGRSTTTCLCIDDPTVELHHAVLSVAANGDASLHQLSGRRPIQIVDVRGTSVAPDLDGALRIGDGGSIVLGATELRVNVARRPARSNAVVPATACGPPELADVLRRLRAAPRATPSACGEVAWSVSLGAGEVPWTPGALDDSSDALAATPLHRATFAWTAQPATVTWIQGPRPACLALTRSIIVQLAIAHPPSAWELVIDTAHQADWEWVTPLARRGAHRSPEPTIRPLAIVDDGSLRRTTERADGRTTVLAIAGTQDPPTDNTIQIGSTGRARWSTDPVDRWFTMTGIGPRRAADLTQLLEGSDELPQRCCDHAVGGSPSNQRGPDPKPAAASSVL